MEASDLKQQVLKYVHRADDKLLLAIKVLVENYENQEIETYSVKGEALTKTQVRQIIEEAEVEYKNGNFIKHKALKDEVKSWKK